MVTNRHEIGHTLFEDDPDLIARALRRSGVDVPVLAKFQHLGTDLSTVQPVERRADRVIRFKTEDGREGIFVLEVQLKKDHDKPRAWGYYGMTLVNRYRVPVMIIVITSSPGCELWARDGFDFGHGLGDALHVRPFVLGPSNVQRVTDVANVMADPRYAALSVIVHRDEGEIDTILEAVAEGVAQSAEPDKAGIYNFIELSLTTPSAAQTWRNLMMLRHDTPLGPTLRGMIDRAVEKAVEKAVDKAKAEFLLKNLELRNISVSSEQRERIENCTDEEQLDEWFSRSVTATTAADVFEN